MWVPFAELPGSSRLWIFQMDKSLENHVLEKIHQALMHFVQHWVSHGTATRASFAIQYQKFLLIAADESVNAIGGCSADALHRELQTIGDSLHVNFFDRNICILSENGGLATYTPAALKDSIEKGLISEQSRVFVLTYTRLADIQQHWPVPIRNTWLKKYFEKFPAQV